jgi:hypothetical protein
MRQTHRQVVQLAAGINHGNRPTTGIEHAELRPTVVIEGPMHAEILVGGVVLDDRLGRSNLCRGRCRHTSGRPLSSPWSLASAVPTPPPRTNVITVAPAIHLRFLSMRSPLRRSGFSGPDTTLPMTA